jgi:hypothetical protein
VVDKDNKLIGNISMSDLKLILFNASEMLFLYFTASEYLEKAHKRDQSIPPKEVSVNPSSTLVQSFYAFYSNR